jgi:aspartate aminotransferase
MNISIAQQTLQLQEQLAPVVRFFTSSTYARRAGEPGLYDLAVGNPQEGPPSGFVEALTRWSRPQHEQWYAYSQYNEKAQNVIAASLAERLQLAVAPQDVLLTNGAFAGLTVSLHTLVDPGDEVIFLSPPWFFYEALISSVGGVPVRVKLAPPDFDLDVAAVAEAITSRTKAIIVNSPHNPSGRVYPPASWQALAQLLTKEGERYGRPIYLLSDEAYSRIVYDGCTFHSPAGYYPYTFLIYTYGKVLLTPGQRLGYIALPSTMPERKAMRQAIFVAQLTTGYAFPNALLQHALPDLETLSIDVGHLQRKRDRLVGEMRTLGYRVNNPEGTFYVLARSPQPDDWAFSEKLAQANLFCLPGLVVELPGYLRFSLTASDQMIDGALSVLAKQEIGHG